MTTDFQGSANDTGQAIVAIQVDGKIVVVGFSEQAGTGRDFALARYNADGSLDTTFDTDGKVTTDFGSRFDQAFGVAIQAADGKIVAAGRTGSDFALARYNPDGSLDSTFDTDGKVTTDFGSFNDVAFGVAIQADGKIVVAGLTGADFALARYNPNGSLDTTFDTDGKVTTDFGSFNDVAFGVAIQAADGKIVAAGRSIPSGTGFDFALARYNPNGSLDTSFSTDGKVTTDFGTFDDQAFAVAIQADGQIVAAGRSQSGTGLDFALARYNPDGSLNTSFSTDGKVTTDFGGFFDEARGVAIQADGKIVAAGSRSFQSGTGVDFALARYNPNGSLDTSFDSDGKVTSDFLGSAGDTGQDIVAIQADGKIVVVGTTSHAGGADFALARYNADGSLDTTFDGDGKVTTDFGNTSDQAFGVAIQADGKIVVAGTSFQPGTGSDFALARYNPNGSLDTSFDTDGKVTTNFGSFSDGASGVAIQADGKIVAAGGTGGDFGLARYNSDGSLDPTFDGDGKVITNFGSFFDQASSVAIQADGKIVAAGFVGFNTGFGTGLAFGLARYNPNGSLDTTFDTDGKVTTDFGSFLSGASGVAIHADGKIVAAGFSLQSGTGFDFALARYNPNGSLDTTFDTDGKVTTDFGSFSDQAFGLAIQADGRIVAAGFSENFSGTGVDFTLARYNPDGSLDTRFSGDGKVTTDFGNSEDVAFGVAIQADGKIVAAGQSRQSGSGFDFALARYMVLSQDKIVAIIRDVQALVTSGALNNGQGNALLVKLQAAIQQLDSGNTTPAINQLQAFVNQVNDFVSRGILTSAQGQPMIDKANAVIAQLNGNPLHAAGGPAVGEPAAEPFTPATLQPVVEQALALWRGSGVDPQALNTLAGLHVQVTDLPGSQLGVASSSGVIWIDQNAAGWGWFIDPTPWEDSEFTTPGDQGEQGRLDLLTVLVHEMGHLLGQEHAVDGVMAESLPTGTRRTPGHAGDQVRITELPGDLLGLALGHTLWLGANAAGWGWFVDPTPWADSEFTTPGDQGEQGKMDLLFAHEIGHLLGQEHAADGVMIDTLATGIRRMPGSTEVNDWSAILDVLVSEPLSKRRW